PRSRDRARQTKGHADSYVTDVVYPQRNARMRHHASERQEDRRRERVGQDDGHGNGRRRGGVTRGERVRIGKRDERERTPHRVARPGPGPHALEDLDDDMQPGVRHEPREPEMGLAERRERQADAERYAGAAEMRDPAHQATRGAGAGPATFTKASESGRPS